MKKKFITILIMTITLANISLLNISGAEAATTDNTSTAATATTDNSTNATSDSGTIKVSLENIRNIVTENSLDIKTLDNKVKIAKEYYDDAKDAYDNAKNTYDNTPNPNASDPKYATDPGAYTTDKEAYSKAQTDYETAQKDYNTDKDNYKSAKQDYDKGVEDQVYTAQQAYINYLSDLSQKTIDQEKVKQKAKNEQIYKLQYENGFISKNQYTSNLQGDTSVNDLSSASDTEELDRINLCSTLGISPEENITFNTDINEDFQVISKINYEEDLTKMLDNNLNIQLANDDITTLDDEIDDETNTTDSTDTIDKYKKENADIALKQAVDTAKTDFQGKYNSLMASYNSLKSSYDVVNEKQKEYEANQISYDYGFAAKNDVDTAKITLDSNDAEFIKEKNQCYLAYLKYIEMKEGY